MYRRLFQEMKDAFALHEVVKERDGSEQDYRFLAVNPEFERLTGLPSDQVLGRTLTDLFPSIDSEWLRRYAEIAETGIPHRFEAYSYLLKKHLEFNAFRMEAAKVAVLIADISDRKKAADALTDSEARSARLIASLKRSEAALADLLDEKDALLKEVHHRVKNNLQIIVSLMNIERGRLGAIGPENEIFTRMQDRVLAIAEVHDALYHSSTFSAADLRPALRALADRLADSYSASARGIAINVYDGELLLPLDLAVPCCLAVNELVSNSLRHAFPDDWVGEKSIDIQADVTDEGRVEVSVKDTGIGIREAAEGEELKVDAGMGGLRFARLLADQLDGELVVSAEAGTAARIGFALP